MSNLKVYRRFIEGLRKHGLTLEEVSQGWKYCGGNGQQRHIRYWETFNNGKRLPFPPREHHCVCNHDIVENCYITDGNGRILVVGNCCIKRFIERSGRTCEICGTPHKNRNVNKCKDCRLGRCDKCGDSCSNKSNICHPCKKGLKRECENCCKLHLNQIVNRCDMCRIGVCDECGKKCRPCFEKCYTCAYLKK
jgi:hypothetical protein